MSDQYPQHDPYDPYDPQQPYGGSGHQHHRPPASYGAPTPTPMKPEDERMWGAIGHGAALAAMVLSAGFLGFLASLAVYVAHKDRGPFVRAHAANSLNVQISMFIWLLVAGVLYVILGIVTLGIGFVVFLPVFLVPLVVAGILHLIGTIKAYNGEWWNPPLTPRFIS
jgi:uncharacterized Tic20 family protein